MPRRAEKTTGKGKSRGKLYPLSMRTSLEIRQRLEDAADASGRSLAQEVERRIEDSFRRPPPEKVASLAAINRSLEERIIALEVNAEKISAESEKLIETLKAIVQSVAEKMEAQTPQERTPVKPIYATKDEDK